MQQQSYFLFKFGTSKESCVLFKTNLKRLSVTNAVNSAASIPVLMLPNRCCSISRDLDANSIAFSLRSVTLQPRSSDRTFHGFKVKAFVAFASYTLTALHSRRSLSGIFINLASNLL